jgi:hypothetical protein
MKSTNPGGLAMQCKGIVKDNIVILEEGVHLPEGATVLITVQSGRQDETLAPEELHQRQALVARMKVFGQKLAGREINLGDLIIEEKEELDDRA